MLIPVPQQADSQAPCDVTSTGQADALGTGHPARMESPVAARMECIRLRGTLIVPSPGERGRSYWADRPPGPKTSRGTS